MAVGPLVSLWARADTRRTQAPGRDGSRSDRTAGASYGLCDPGSVGHRGKCAERPGDPLPLEPCSSVPQHWAPAPPWAAEPCPAVAGKLGGKWTQCAVPLCTHACPCAHTRASVHTHVPLLVSEVRQPQPPPLVGSALGGLPAFSGRPWWAGVSGSHCLLRLAASLPQARPHSCDRSRQWFPLFRCHRRPEGEPEVG